MNILIVEDNALIAMAYEVIAMEAGYDVTAVASDTASAFKQAQILKPDIALVDLRLTDGLTGNEIALGLSENHGVRSIIIITGNVTEISREARDVSIAVLTKPISRAVLKQALDVGAVSAKGHP